MITTERCFNSEFEYKINGAADISVCSAITTILNASGSDYMPQTDMLCGVKCHFCKYPFSIEELIISTTRLHNSGAPSLTIAILL